MTAGNAQKFLSGVLVIDKPGGCSSYDVIRRIKRATGIKKIGHTGTLDPMATGVMVICLNQATKLVPFLQDGEKEYAGRIVLGLTTDTDDITGRVTEKRINIDLTHQEVVAAAEEFVGLIEQVPPAYSALKFQGRPGYKMARSGEKVPVRSRRVVVHDLAITGIDLPHISFYARVSKGTYIRSIASDLGRRLGTGACLETLRRLASGPFNLTRALSLEEMESLAAAERLDESLISKEQALEFMPEVRVDEDLARQVGNGRPLPISGLEHFTPSPGPVRVSDPGGGLIAVYHCNPPTGARENQCLTPLRVLGGN